MAVVKKNEHAAGPLKVSTTPVKREGLCLPTERSVPDTNLAAYSWLIYGEKKIGKTSLCAEFPAALLLEFEPGAKSLSAFQMDVPAWSDAIEICKLLGSTKHSYQNVVIDIGKIAYERCQSFVCERARIEHPGDLGFGKGWSILANEFKYFHLDLTANKLGTIIIAHEVMRERESYSGLKYQTLEPDLTGASMNFYHGMVDTIARYFYVGKKRFLAIRGDESIVAGTRCNNNFLTPSGEPIRYIPMGNSAKEAYANLVRAFNNQQTETYDSLLTKSVETAGTAPAKKKVG